jgi:hypothetical protein
MVDSKNNNQDGIKKVADQLARIIYDQIINKHSNKYKSKNNEKEALQNK